VHELKLENSALCTSLPERGKLHFNRQILEFSRAMEPAAGFSMVAHGPGCAGSGNNHFLAVVMHRCLLLGFLLGLAVVGARAAEGGFRTSKRQVRQEVVAAVTGQLAAFRAEDVSKAYDYAAAGMRAQTSLRRFAAIVRENYPEIWANERAEFGLVRDDGTHATVLVHVVSARGGATFDYVLIRERGGWRIGSVLRHQATRRNSV
jgi:hypothetical protein